MKIAKCPSVILKAVDDELSKLEYSELQRLKSFMMFLGISMAIMILVIVEHP
jgi:hypothetical protein